jgi:uncharacterized small protein (DUF1192 family)
MIRLYKHHPLKKEKKMARSISVKVPTSLLIQQIEERIAQIDKEIEEYPAKRQKFEKDSEAHKKTVAKFVSDYLSKNANKVGYDHDSVIRISEHFMGNRVELIFDTSAMPGFPKRPEMPQTPNQREWFGREHNTRKELLEKNLRILKMTSQEEVNASTYGAIMEII